MFDIGLQEMLVIGVLALLVFGPSKLPELGRMVGRAMRELRRASDEFRSTVETNLHINDPDSPPEPRPASSAEENLPDPDDVVPVGSSEPAISSTPASQEAGAAVATEEHAEPFCARRGSPLFHRRECQWAARIPDIERVNFASMSDALEKGLARCPSCEPWEPS
jgi:Tat protein translocase TatB subunit